MICNDHILLVEGSPAYTIAQLWCLNFSIQDKTSLGKVIFNQIEARFHNTTNFWGSFYFRASTLYLETWPRPRALAPHLYLSVLVPNLYLPALIPNFCLPKFLLSVRSLSLHIPYPPNLYLLALAHDLYYHFETCIYIYHFIGSSSSGSRYISSSSNFFGIDNTNSSIPFLVN